MKASKQELIDAQLARAEESLATLKTAVEAGFWNSAASDLYYAFFYFIRVLFSIKDIDTQTHKGVKTLFAKEFIKEGSLEKKWGDVLAKLYELRQQGDYGDFGLTEEAIEPYIRQVQEFKTIVLALVQRAGYKTNNES